MATLHRILNPKVSDMYHRIPHAKAIEIPSSTTFEEVIPGSLLGAVSFARTTLSLAATVQPTPSYPCLCSNFTNSYAPCIIISLVSGLIDTLQHPRDKDTEVGSLSHIQKFY